MCSDQAFPVVTAESWTSRQRQTSSLHEIFSCACFKPQLPRFFIDRLSEPGDVVYDPFMGRRITVIKAVPAGRRGIGNDGNPFSSLLTQPRLGPPSLQDVATRLDSLKLSSDSTPCMDLSMFYDPRTRREVVGSGWSRRTG